jgi:archaellum component FlaC
MSETGNVYMREEEENPATSNKSPTPESLHSPTTDQIRSANATDTKTVICSNAEMAKIAEKVETIKNWTIKNFKTSKQSVLEKFGKVEKTTDVDMDNRISALNDLHNRYREILIAATAYSTHFNALNAAQKSLAESFYQLSLRESEMKERLNEQNETMRQFTQSADEFSKQLSYFVSSMETLCTKTIRDTLQTVDIYENARLEYDAHRHELTMMQQTAGVAGKTVDDLQAKVESLKQKYEQLKEDVRVKLALLDENRLKVMKDQLTKFEKGLHQYFTGSIKALSQNSPTTEDNDSIFLRGEARGSSSFLEQ